jgi:hypothetical protein
MKRAAVIWLLWCAFLNCAGWILSSLHQINTAGYLVVVGAGLLALAAWRTKNQARFFPARFWKKLSRRCRHPLPAVFSLATALVFLGGILYAPNNFDALTYRLPRMLHWMASGQWFWIPTFNDRMNCANVAWEWTAMPFFALLHSERAMFLINATGYLLMPGLLFSIFRQLGVAAKTAWTWMWLLPLAYGCVTQAGSIGNDLFGAIFSLLAVDFGLRARASNRIGDVWLALLAVALMTGTKVSNLPLVLPCVIAVWPALNLLQKNLAASFGVFCVAAAVSALPMMGLNYANTGSWTGDPTDQYKMRINNPVAGILGNGFLVGEASLQPPLLPGSHRVDAALSRLKPAWLDEQFPRLRINRLNEIPGEEGAGLGLGIVLPLFIILVSGIFSGGSARQFLLRISPVVFAAWIALAVYLAKIGSEAAARLMLPYYFLAVVPFLLLRCQAQLLKRRWWRVFLTMMAMGTLPVLIFSVSRPLWPAQTISEKLAKLHPQNETWQRLAAAYETYAHRNDFLAPLRKMLPDDARKIGFIAGSNDTDYSFWRPIGHRIVVYPRHDLQRFLAQPDVEWLVVKANVWPGICAVPLADWTRARHAEIVGSVSVVELVSWGPEQWTLIHLPKPEADVPPPPR